MTVAAPVLKPVSQIELAPGSAIAQIVPETVERGWQVGSCQALEELEAKIADLNS
ncbi:MAG: hypothetical protein SWY16_16695 [Cyanobacteriota bacterium]|nr:hypothetical protein [Cyanobacteriota bacterium]